MKTYTGKIEVSDEVVSYKTTLVGQWTLGQVIVAFADGYDTGEAAAGEEFSCTVESGYDGDGVPQYADEFTLTCDGMGGVEEKGKYPHKVTWIG